MVSNSSLYIQLSLQPTLSARFYFTTQISITIQINTERLLSSYLCLTVYLSPPLCFFFNKYNTIMPTLLEMMIARVALRPLLHSLLYPLYERRELPIEKEKWVEIEHRKRKKKQWPQI
ncbi:hypothetical protein SO802_000992 [Lithocarpus litseifolius]|uniref:Uncharacterized protein n=1 Tax=Lithocarpus litseifolius TaxID=425828 RepID=A0AAW2DTE6_9ROSI